jgi:plasmid stabilization system protein ParE
MPALGPRVRVLAYGSYLILHQVGPREVVVLRVVHGMRDLDGLELV